MIPATRYAKIRSSQPSVTDRFPVIQTALDHLAGVSDAQYDGLRSALSSGDLYMRDLLVLSLISRSLELIDGFIGAIHGWRVFVASSLVRLQADNLARMHLGAITNAPEELVLHIADGQPLNKLKVPQELRDSIAEPGLDTRRFSDRVLMALASQEHPWIREVTTPDRRGVSITRPHICSRRGPSKVPSSRGAYQSTSISSTRTSSARSSRR